jgi:hypothetical protein
MELTMASLMRKMKNMKNVGDSGPARMHGAGREEVFQYLEKVMKLSYFICSLPGCKGIKAGRHNLVGIPSKFSRSQIACIVMPGVPFFRVRRMALIRWMTFCSSCVCP